VSRPRTWLVCALFSSACGPSSGGEDSGGSGSSEAVGTTAGPGAPTGSSADPGSTATTGSTADPETTAAPEATSDSACTFESPGGGNPDGDPDDDGLVTACDACPLSPATGAVAGENCCDPRTDVCAQWFPGANLRHPCNPDHNGLRFPCDQVMNGCTDSYRRTCASNNCNDLATCLPAGALLSIDDCGDDDAAQWHCRCDESSCTSKWCTVGDDLPCEAGMGCLAWYGPGEAPPGLQDLGLCARLDAGPCAGLPARACARLPSN